MTERKAQEKFFANPLRPGLAGEFILLPLIAVCLAFLTATRLRAQGENNGVIAGRITDSRGQPQRVMARLLAPGDVPVGEMFTDSNGLFAFQALPNGNYYVTVEASGFQPVRQHVMLDLRINPKMQVFVSLEALEKGPKDSGPIVPGSARSYELDAKKPPRALNPKAQREFEKGNEEERQGDLQAALTHYQKALQIEPAFYPALNNLGAVYLRQKEVGRAEEAFLKLLALNPEDGEPYINLGHALYEEGKYPEATERLEEGLKRSPRSPVGHFILGSAYLKLGELDKAEPHLKIARAYDAAGMPRARLQLANLYLKRHDLKAAGAELEAYLQSNPTDPQAPAIKKMLANIKEHRAE